MSDDELDLVVAMEECSELIQAISKYLRGKNHNIEEEIADVRICIDKVIKICGLTSDKIDEWYTSKMDRLNSGYR